MMNRYMGKDKRVVKRVGDDIEHRNLVNTIKVLTSRELELNGKVFPVHRPSIPHGVLVWSLLVPVFSGRYIGCVVVVTVVTTHRVC
jgi:hypothetical protein